jgi:dienelactone hydrolase
MKSLARFASFALFVLLAASSWAAQRFTGPWDLPALTAETPKADWGEPNGLVRPVYYEGATYHGKPTRVFAYYGRPAEGDGPFPAMLLVHGGGGKAFEKWAEHWAARGYAALAMDLSGNGPEGRLPDGGPNQDDDTKFREFTDADVRDMWSYHAVAAVLRGHSLLASLPEVDRQRIGVTGISWGGYLTCIVAGIDERLKVAVPVYGCGFLHENSVWRESRFDKMTAEQRERWVSHFDPSKYLPGVSCPILFVNGTNDFAYPLDSYQKSYSLVKAPRTLSIRVGLPHGHIWTFQEVDAFVDSVSRDGKPLASISITDIEKGTAVATTKSAVPLAKAELHYTADVGRWQERKWTTVAAELKDGTISARVPDERPLAAYLSVTDGRGLLVSSPHFEIPAADVAYEWQKITTEAPFAPRDGAGALSFAGKMWLLGGWNPGATHRKFFPKVCNNEVWSSADGASWDLVRANTYGEPAFDPAKEWEGRHTAGYAVFQDKMWIIGGDCNQGHYQNDVWNSTDGKTWTPVSREVPWAPRALHYTVVHDGKIWVMGGQTMPAFAKSDEKFYRDIWTTTDGVKWEQVQPKEPFWPARGMIGGSAVHKGRIWILGGGTYDTPATPTRQFFNDIWSSADGITWQRDATAPWEPRQYHDVAVWDNRLWVMEGYNKANRNDVWHSADGVSWQEVKDTPWKPRHAASVFVHAGALWMVAGNNMEADVWKLRRADQ